MTTELIQWRWETNLRMLSGFIDHCFTQARNKVHTSNINACSGSQDSSVKVTELSILSNTCQYLLWWYSSVLQKNYSTTLMFWFQQNNNWLPRRNLGSSALCFRRGECHILSTPSRHMIKACLKSKEPCNGLRHLTKKIPQLTVQVEACLVPPSHSHLSTFIPF